MGMSMRTWSRKELLPDLLYFIIKIYGKVDEYKQGARNNSFKDVFLIALNENYFYTARFIMNHNTKESFFSLSN